MHFRIRKNVVQLIRTAYDDSKKKGINSIIGTVQLSKPSLSDNLRMQLTAEEICAFEIWINTQHRTSMLREEMAAMTLAETMALAEKWFERNSGSSATHTVVRDIVFHWQSLRKVLAQKGLLE
ncbi:MAG: hypothetical protein Q8N96_06825 [Methylovulum sp.]|nr:hypothetical protein [Methylovulum sp.]